MRTKWENPCVIGRIIVPQKVHVLEILLSRPHPSHIKSRWDREVCSKPPGAEKPSQLLAALEPPWESGG